MSVSTRAEPSPQQRHQLLLLGLHRTSIPAADSPLQPQYFALGNVSDWRPLECPGQRPRLIGQKTTASVQTAPRWIAKARRGSVQMPGCCLETGLKSVSAIAS